MDGDGKQIVLKNLGSYPFMQAGQTQVWVNLNLVKILIKFTDSQSSNSTNWDAYGILTLKLNYPKQMEKIYFRVFALF